MKIPGEWQQNGRNGGTSHGSLPARVTLVVSFACIIVSYVILIVGLHPSNLFGLTGDDAIYLSSAKALAEGRGYILPSVPGNPPATKYPIFYPWILSLMWRLNPSFPANLPLAISISVAFGVGYLVTAFATFLRLGGFSRTEALALFAYCALHPLVQYFGASVLSDMPFGLLALASMLAADSGIRDKDDEFKSVSCGILAGIAVLTRMLGFPILLGILTAAAVRRSWRHLIAIALSAAPFVIAAAWQALLSNKPNSAISGLAGMSLGWNHAWTFYTDYAGIWKLGIPSGHVFWAMLRNNAVMVARVPADLLLGPTFIRDTILGRVLVLVVAFVTAAGLVRQARAHGWKPVHYGLVFYTPVTLFWNYPDTSRFFLPFWPLLIAGAWFEGRRALGLVASTLSAHCKTYEKCAGVAVGLVIVLLGAGAAENSAAGMRIVVKQTSKARSALFQDKWECYDWIRRNTDPDAHLVAYEDATAYLYTGRQTMPPILFTTDEFYEPERLNQANSHFLDVAKAIHAEYWMFADDDFSRDWPAGAALAENHMRQLERVFPVVFRGVGGAVTVRLAQSLVDGTARACCQVPTAVAPSNSVTGK